MDISFIKAVKFISQKRNKKNKNIKAVMFVGEAKEITTICI
jgi:hypothetical protein